MNELKNENKTFQELFGKFFKETYEKRYDLSKKCDEIKVLYKKFEKDYSMFKRECKQFVKKVKVYYRVVTKDHTGYCSGMESETDGTTASKRLEEVQDLPELLPISMFENQVLKDDEYDYSKFDREERGCTSGGSGYCKGFGSLYITYKVEALE